jgi:D-alanyl-D-alanine carboxypeptidase/D-alanyl-D-alanine-endopeptidase (penicillin-binding protein 4)
MGKPSDNTIAEMLLKGLGRDFGAGGTTAAGAAVVRAQLVQCGAPAGGLRVLDGSGLSYGNRLTAYAVTRLLVYMSTRMDFDTYWSSLAVGGRDGTLRLRMRGTLAVDNVHAKTGTLSIASCLSGYLTTRDREGVAFSILMNGWPLDAGRARAAQDALAAALARADL